jgi:hypothetical protein
MTDLCLSTRHYSQKLLMIDGNIYKSFTRQDAQYEAPPSLKPTLLSRMQTVCTTEASGIVMAAYSMRVLSNSKRLSHGVQQCYMVWKTFHYFQKTQSWRYDQEICCDGNAHISTLFQKTVVTVYIPYILEINPHLVFATILNENKLVRASNPHLSFNRPLPTGRLFE